MTWPSKGFDVIIRDSPEANKHIESLLVRGPGHHVSRYTLRLVLDRPDKKIAVCRMHLVRHRLGAKRGEVGVRGASFQVHHLVSNNTDGK